MAVIAAGGGGGVVATGGTAITDDRIVRGSPVGIQGSGVALNDADAISGVTQLDVGNLRLDGNTLSKTGGVGVTIDPGGDPLTIAAGSVSMMAGDFAIQSGQLDIFAGDLHVSGDIASSAGTVSGPQLIAGSNLIIVGLTTRAGAATTTELPSSGMVSLHKNSSSGVVSLAYNDGGVIKAVALA